MTMRIMKTVAATMKTMKKNRITNFHSTDKGEFNMQVNSLNYFYMGVLT